MRCPAKINLFLKVTGKRPDGYHTLETLFLPFDGVADSLTLADGPAGVRCTVDGAEFPDNLVCRAAEAYAERAGLDPAWDFALEKHIPIAAGLGGGSSDAAGALKLLNERYGRFSADELAGIAVGIGADVPFFLAPRPAWAAGIGEELRPLAAVPDLPLVVVNPGFPVSAKWAYSHLDPAHIGPADTVRTAALETALTSGNARGVAAALHNELEYALYDKFPLLGILREFMLAHGARGVIVSGSGSSLFGVCADFAAGHALASALAEAFAEAGLRIFEAGAARPEA